MVPGTHQYLVRYLVPGTLRPERYTPHDVPGTLRLAGTLRLVHFGTTGRYVSAGTLRYQVPSRYPPGTRYPPDDRHALDGKEKPPTMTGNQLKMVALITMTIDHIGVILLPQYPILRIIGRLSFPIFAYMVAEGCHHTHDKRRYLEGIVLLGLLCQAVFFITIGSLEQSILTTLALGIVTVYAMQSLDRRRDIIGIIICLGALGLDVVACFILPHFLANMGYRIDYGFAGVLLPALCYLPRLIARDMEDGRRRTLTLAPLTAGLLLVAIQTEAAFRGIQLFALLAVPLLAMYNGQRGKRRLKHLFYIYYPAHLVVIWMIALVLD